MNNNNLIFDKAFEEILKTEGGFVDDPLDKGGATKYGITEKVARLNGFSGNMKDFPLALAKDIYKREYWNPLKLDEISSINEKIALEMFDSAVNVGVQTVGKWFQTALNLLNNNQNFQDLIVDGIFGQKTMNTFKSLDKKDFDRIFKVLNILQGAHYINITQRNESQERFIRGWLSRVV